MHFKASMALHTLNCHSVFFVCLQGVLGEKVSPAIIFLFVALGDIKESGNKELFK